jgi:hypothetical protein
MEKTIIDDDYIPSEKEPADFLSTALPIAKRNACITTLHLEQ